MMLLIVITTHICSVQSHAHLSASVIYIDVSLFCFDVRFVFSFWQKEERHSLIQGVEWFLQCIVYPCVISQI